MHDDYEYMGRYGGWHLYVWKNANREEARDPMGLSGDRWHGLAIPPVDDPPHLGREVFPPPDARRVGGASKAEALYKAVELMYAAAGKGGAR
jgi:hypothetical protein